MVFASLILVGISWLKPFEILSQMHINCYKNVLGLNYDTDILVSKPFESLSQMHTCYKNLRLNYHDSGIELNCSVLCVL